MSSGRRLGALVRRASGDAPRHPAPARLVVHGWWPRWRGRSAASDGVVVSIDGQEVARLNGYGPRRWSADVPAGDRTVTLVTIGPWHEVTLRTPVELRDDEVATVVFRSAYRRWLFSARHAADIWIVPRRTRSTWFPPHRPTGR